MLVELDLEATCKSLIKLLITKWFQLTETIWPCNAVGESALVAAFANYTW